MQENAKLLVANGYHIVPISSGQKGPRVREWQKREFTPDVVTAGVGVKTGVGESPVCAVDIDVLDPKLARAFSDYCQAEYGLTVERVGQAPKTMLVYRAAEAGWRKATSKWFEDDKGMRQRLEVLGAGQQFVAYHIHPETNKPYEWIDMLGGLDSTPVSELPVLTAKQVTELIEHFERMATDAGLVAVSTGSASTKVTVKDNTDPDDFTAGMPVGLSIEEAEGFLENLDASDYEFWIKIGASLYHEFSGSEEAFELWLNWSKTAKNFEGEEDLQRRWPTFANGSGLTGGTLIHFGSEANKKAERESKIEQLQEFTEAIANTADIFELTDDVLRSIGKQVTKKDIVIVKAVTDAAVKHSKELGHTLTKTEVRQALGIKDEAKLADNTNISAINQTEFGCAKRMVLDNKDSLLFEVQTESWFIWNGNVWQRVTSTDVESLAVRTVENLAEDLDELGVHDPKEKFTFIQKTHSARNIIAMVRLVKSADEVRVNIDDLDADKNLFTVANGMVDLKTGKLIPSDPNKHMTIASEVAYDATAECPVFLETITDIFSGDTDMVAFMARWFGYQMLGDPKEDKIGIPYGSGANGKSTLFNIIRDVFGGHAMTADASTFLGTGAQSGGGPREDILRLQGARMVNVTEPSENSVLKEGLIKAMTGGETMPARGAYGKHTVEVVPTWVTNMPTNHKPIIKGDDHGIWRRLMLIPFERNFDKDDSVKKDIHRSDKLKAEMSGILNWLIAGCIEYQEIGLKPPKKVFEATAGYKSEMDLLSDFIETCCDLGEDKAASNTELWATWQRYAAERGELGYIPSARSLGRRMTSQGFEAIRSTHGITGRGYKGIGIKSVFGGEE